MSAAYAAIPPDFFPLFALCGSSLDKQLLLLGAPLHHLAYRIDFRAVPTEIFRGHFGVSEVVVRQTIPECDSLVVADPQGFEAIGFPS